MSAVPGHDQVREGRDEQIQRILNELRAERAAGRHAADDEVLARHPELREELAAALKLLSKLQTSIRQVTAVAGEEELKLDEPEIGGASLPRIKGFRLQKLIQRGGQAAVFLAIQESTRRKVAVKVMDGGAFITRRNYARFGREAKALVAIDHPGIVRIVDRGRTEEGSFFIAMDFVDGEDLDAYLERRRKEGWDIRGLVGLFAKIAAAMGEAHRLNIVHRDIKPSNVRVDARGEPRVLDFGLARLMSPGEETRDLTVTQVQGVVGSLPWASPEQASGDAARICPASDVYSLGICLYRALTGKSPYDLSGMLREQMRIICEVAPAKIGETSPFGTIDPILAGVILKCLEKDPAHRYRDGRALATELEGYLAGRLQAAPVRPNRWRYVAMAGISIAALAAAAGVLLHKPAVDDKQVIEINLPTLANSIGMEFTLIPATSFGMGAPLYEEGRDQNEEPHLVTLTHPYYIARTEVTRSEYRRIMGALPANTPTSENDDRLPVDYVSRNDADEFCRRLSRAEGKHYRLPTEAEWENACRAGSTRSFSGTGLADDMAWHSKNSDGHGHPGATKHANHWGLYDMEGNVAEWCADRYIDRLGTRPVTDPFAPPTGNEDGVVRGGSFSEYPLRCRAAARKPLRSDQHTIAVGFRLAMDPPPTSSTTRASSAAR